MGSFLSRMEFDRKTMDGYFQDFLSKYTVEDVDAFITAPVFVSAFITYFKTPVDIANKMAPYINEYFRTDVIHRVSEWNMGTLGYYNDLSMFRSPAFIFTGRRLDIQRLQASLKN